MKNIKLPKNWNDVTVEQFITLKNIIEKPDDLYYIRYIEILSILTDTMPDDKIWKDIKIIEITNLIDSLTWLRTEPTTKYKEIINNNKIINLFNLSFGEWLDIENLFGENLFNNLPKICGLLYRKIKIDEWDNEIFQPYDNVDYNKTIEFYENLPITDIYGIISYYTNFRKMFTSTYENLLEPKIDLLDDIETDYELDEEDIKLEKEEKLNEKWGWERVINKLSNGDITKTTEILNLPVIFVMNHLSMLKELNL
jgi:hypothetical protein